MLSLFRTNQITVSFLFIFYLVLLRLGSYFVLQDNLETIEYSIFATPIIDYLSGNFWLKEIVTILLMVIQATALSLIVMENRLARELSLYPGVFYLLLLHSNPYFLSLSGVLMANSFFILALYEILKTYRKTDAAVNIFNIGLWIGLGSLFYYPMALLVIWSIIGLNFLRRFSIKELLLLLVGAFIPYWILGVYHFWNNSLEHLLQVQVYNNLQFFKYHFYSILEEYAAYGFYVLMLLITFLSGRAYLLKHNIKTQNKINVIYWSLFIGMLILLIFPLIDFRGLLLLSVPLSIFISFNFIILARKWAEWLHLLWFAACILFLLKPLIF